MMRINKNIRKNFLKQQGFTILEVLIAVAIMAVMVGGAYIVFGDSASSKLKNKAYQLMGKVQIAQEESIIRGVEFGLRVEGNTYYFMIFDGEVWQPLQEDKLLAPVELEDTFGIFAQVEGQESLLKNAEVSDDDSGLFDEKSSDKNNTDRNSSDTDENNTSVSNKQRVTPQIFMLSSGEMNEFSLTIGLERDEGKFYRIKGGYLGSIEMTKRPIEGHYKFDWDKEEPDEDF